MPNFKSFWSDYAPKAEVTRLGVLSEQQKRDFFAAIDLHALPSRSDSFGLVLLEVWANGKPNVAYRAGGPGELMQHGSDGLLARCGDIDALSTHLGELVGGAALRDSLGESGRARIAREFGWGDKLELVERTLRGVSPSLEDHEVNVSVRAQNMKHRPLLRTRLLDRAAKLFR
jgi:glycosyltransferase involved in cell wall biosynthesis